MTKLTKDRAAEYVLGLLPPEEHDAMARAASRDPALARDIEKWNEKLAPLLDSPEVPPPPGLFDRIMGVIGSATLPNTLTVRAGDGSWERLVEGVERKMLWHDQANGRSTFLIRAEPGSRFPAHDHDDDEECYVISGDLTFDTLTLHAGDYHLAKRGMRHPVGTTAGGCMILVTAAG